MTKADLHVHSRHSQHPSEWFLQRIGTRESYTDVETVYRLAKSRGMTYVTLTDHNAIDGAVELVRAHPEDCFISTEATAYFPEDGCKVHVLCYDITPGQFDAIQEHRHDIYRFRDYLREQDIACSVAHATYSVNGKLRRQTLEKLILLFDVFEGINGARYQLYNQAWLHLLQYLTPRDIGRFYNTHKIEPWGTFPWIKGFTGGSDDHAGLFVGETYTMAEAGSMVELLDAVRSTDTMPGGRHGDHKSLAFAVYKIAYEFTRDKTGSGGDGFMGLLSAKLFENGSPGFRNWLAIQKLKLGKDWKHRVLTRFFEDIAESRLCDGHDAEEKVNAVYNSLAGLSDDFFRMVLQSLEKDLQSGDTGRVFKNLSAFLPAGFMITPFFTTLRHMHHDRKLLSQLRTSFPEKDQNRQKQILWFSDTVVDLNGVSVTMCELARCAHRMDRAMQLVTSLPDAEQPERLPPNTINLPCIYAVTPDFYTSFTLRVPSILRAIDRLARENPDEIVISTPGPVGLLGLAFARLLGIKCTGIYHTDFSKQADHFIGDAWVSSMIETYTRWFYRLMDEVRVPTQQYINLLSERGLDPDRMQVFRRGVESSFRVNDRKRQQAIRGRLHIADDVTVLVWAGRLGKEKNLDFLLDIYREATRQRQGLVLLLIGDGPEQERLQRETADDAGVVFAGRVDRADLAHYYFLGDMLVFPSTTDTYGMVVLEAQACGLPAIVTDVGGPQEIVCNGETGFVVKAGDRAAWVAAAVGMADMKRQDPDLFQKMRDRAQAHVSQAYDWGNVLDDMMGRSARPDAGAETDNSRESMQTAAVAG